MAYDDHEVYCCLLLFFYSPGEHHCVVLRTEFYAELKKGFDYFDFRGKVFLLGDTNARLGCYLDDRNLQGMLVSNKNKPLLLGFLDYTGVSILNKSFAFGNATYEIPTKKRSIIDIGFTKEILDVKNFEVLDRVLGCTSQTCHKILRLTLKMSATTAPNSALPKVKRLYHFSYEGLIKV